jgi:metallo-beta-lactamase family protein
MKIEFVGGARTVTGSSFILKDEDFTIMVDCGMFQGRKELRERNALNLIYDPPKIDALLLTHAHIDHSGLIPKLVKNGFYGNIYTHRATADLCGIMLPDSAHIQEMETDWTNRRNRKLGRAEVAPLYTVDDANACQKNFVSMEYDQVTRIHPRVEVRFRDAGHILGSAIIEVWVDEGGGKKKKIVFSGDLGSKDQSIINDPAIVDEADVLVIESTYGDRPHRSRTDTYKEFSEIIRTAYNKKGNIIIPAFAVERTQEIVYTLARLIKSGEIPAIPVYVDSPLAISATEIFRKNEVCFDDKTRALLKSGDSPLDFPGLTFTRSVEDSKMLNDMTTGAIIISASGMCTAGRIKYHLLNNLYKPDSSVMFVGFQAEGTLGRRLVDGAKQVTILGEDVIVKSKIHTLNGFSGHADCNGLFEWVSEIKNDKLKAFVVHGEERSSMAFSDTLKTKLGIQTHVPMWGEIVDIDTMSSEMAVYGSSDSFSEVDTEIDALTETLAVLKVKYGKAREKSALKDMQKLKDEINDARVRLSGIADEL